ncbi:MAG: HAD family hydrolase [Lawsonibacter sp.]|jgi:2-haloacid dehalogenase
MIQVVLIDIDDTLLSFSGYVKEAMRDGFAQYGLKPYTETMFPVFERINNGLWAQIEQGTLSFEELTEIRWNTIFHALGISFDGRIFERYFRDKLFFSAVPEPGAVELLEYLSRRYRLCIASNGPYEQQINRLRVGKLYDFFSHFFISSQIGAQKPSPAFFDFCFKELRSSGFPNLSPEDTMIIGDSLSSDIAGGAGYGMHTCLYQKKPVSALDVSRADHVVGSLAEIQQIL